MKLLAISIATLLVCTGCPVGGGTSTPIGANDDLPDLPAGGSVVIANSLSETLSSIDLTTTPPQLTNDIALTGQAPNALLLHGDQVLVLNSLSNSLQVLDLATLATVAEYSTGPRTNPWDLVVDDDGIAWITCWVSQELIGIALADGATVARIPAPSGEALPHPIETPTKAHPQGIGRDPASGTISIAIPNLDALFLPQGPGLIWQLNRDGVSYIDAALRSITGTTYASDIEATTIGGRSALVVACSGPFDPGTGYVEAGAIAWIDGPTGTVRELRSVDSAPVYIAVRGSQVWCAGAQTGDVVGVDFANEDPPIRLTLPDSGTGLNYTSALAFADDTTLLALQFNADRLYAIDTESLAVSGGVTLGDGPVALIVVPRD